MLLELQRPAEAGLFVEDDRLASGGFLDGASDALRARVSLPWTMKIGPSRGGLRCAARGCPVVLRGPQVEAVVDGCSLDISADGAVPDRPTRGANTGWAPSDVG